MNTGNLSTEGTISAAGGNFEVDASGWCGAAGGEFTVAGSNGTVTIGSDTDNQTIIVGGNFSSEATNGTAKNITDSSANHAKVTLTNTGTTYETEATAGGSLTTVETATTGAGSSISATQIQNRVGSGASQYASTAITNGEIEQYAVNGTDNSRSLVRYNCDNEYSQQRFFKHYRRNYRNW